MTYFISLLAKEVARCLHGIGFNLLSLEVYKWGNDRFEMVRKAGWLSC